MSIEHLFLVLTSLATGFIIGYASTEVQVEYIVEKVVEVPHFDIVSVEQKRYEDAIQLIKDTLFSYALFCTRGQDVVHWYKSDIFDGTQLPPFRGDHSNAIKTYMSLDKLDPRKRHLEMYLARQFPTLEEANIFLDIFLEQNVREILLGKESQSLFSSVE